MNRRDFLKSTSGMLVPAALARSQEPAIPVATSYTFADFESGAFDGWTLTGDLRSLKPATVETWKGKITGFQGKRFLCTLHPTLGNNATGKAVSREFTIEKPFINFLIGGGNHPGEACLNLVVDGKVVRSETGKWR